MAAFQFYLQSKKQRKVGLVGDGSHVVFGKKKSPCEKVIVSHCFLMMQQPVFAAKVPGKVFANYQAVAVKRRGSMRN
jgi:hypothetical protein